VPEAGEQQCDYGEVEGEGDPGVDFELAEAAAAGLRPFWPSPIDFAIADRAYVMSQGDFTLAGAPGELRDHPDFDAAVGFTKNGMQ